MFHFLSPGFAWMLAAPALILVLYLLRRRFLPRQVPSVFLWRKSVKDYAANRPFQRLMKNLLLPLQILAALALGCMIFCLKSTGKIGWSGIAVLGTVMGWVWIILPLLFSRWRPMIFLPIDFACLGGYLLYLCASTGGNWFLSFAFPVTLMAAVLTLAGVAMIRYIVQGRLRLMSLLLITIGLSFMLVEFFQHITFGTPMFVWSLYCVTGFCLIGLFLFIASFIPPLRAALRRKFFF